MNYFAHAHRFLLSGDADPYFLAGTAVPDWLNVVARRTKCRPANVQPYLSVDDPIVAELARGIAQHHHDDRWFHGSRTFVELSLRFAKEIHLALGDASDLRAGFLGHILIELLLDAELIADDRTMLDNYYGCIDSVDANEVARIVARMSNRPVGALSTFISQFVNTRFLADYEDDRRLCHRVGQVLHRIGLQPLPPLFVELVPWLRGEVGYHRRALLRADQGS